jgi:DNA-binding beta-propeller fold protein YncE
MTQLIRICTLLTAVVACAPLAGRSQGAMPLTQIGTIALPMVSGRIDHLAFDAARQRLFVAALGNNTVEVLDTGRNAHVRSLGGFHEPQGIAVASDVGGVAIANGGTGTLQFIDAQTLAARWTVRVGGDADNVRYDAAARRLYVAAEGGIYSIDPSAGKSAGRISIDGHPESFQLESTGTLTFANLPGLVTSQIVAADRKTQAVTARWSSFGCSGNYPMALDEAASRIFVGCRRPARLAMLDTRSGKTVAAVDIVGDTDDLFFDASRQLVYVVGGEGYVDVIHRNGDSLTRAARIATRSGARTGLWVATLNRLYVAAPARNGQPAAVLVFEAR